MPHSFLDFPFVVFAAHVDGQVLSVLDFRDEEVQQLCCIQLVIVECVPEYGIHVIMGVDKPACIEPFIHQVERCVAAHGLSGLFLKESEEFFVRLWCDGFRGLVNAGVDVGAVVTVLFLLCSEDVCEAGLDGGVIEWAVLTVGGEIGVVIGKDGLALARIVL